MSKKDPNFLEGIWVGKQMLKDIDKTYYGTVENAIKKKTELAEDLRDQFKWKDDEPELARVLGIIEGLQQSASGNYTIVAQQPGLDAAKSLSQMESILEAHPQVRVVCSIGSGGDIGANEALMTETKGIIPSDMGIFSADATEQQLTAIVKGEASRASVGMEGSNIKTAEACVALYEKLLNNETFSSKNVFRPLTVMDISNAAQYLQDFAADKQKGDKKWVNTYSNYSIL